jgi:putative ABC transport system permease protein
MRPWGVRRLFRLPGRTRAEVRRDVDDELAFHLDTRADELEKQGLDPASARSQAEREFGSVAASARALTAMDDRTERRQQASQYMAELVQDAGIGLRLLIRAPGFAAVAILTLALGIGANTAIYSVVDAVLLRPLPYPEPDRLVLVSETLPDGQANSASGGAFLDWRQYQRSFDALVLTGRVTMNLRGEGPPERLTGMEVSHELLDVLRVPPLVGRGFLPKEDRPGGASNVVLLTEELWRSHFGGDPSIVGRTIVLDEVPRVVIGVLPAGAWLMKEDQFFVPAVLIPDVERGASRASHWASVFGRLAPGVSARRAEDDLRLLKQRLNPEYPDYKQDWSVRVQPVADVLNGITRTPMLILLTAVALLLLIACANVANLLLARGCHRQHEIAVRAALGASGGRIVRQVLTENLVLALIGGGAGILVAWLGVRLLVNFGADAMPFGFVPQVDFRVLAFSTALTVLIGPLIGLLPALRARRARMSGALTGSRAGGSGMRQRTQSILIVTEVALTVVLLASTGLLVRSLLNTADTDPGFEPAGVLAFDLSLPDASYGSRDRRYAFASTLLDRLRALPGVEAAGTGMAIPFSGGGYGEFFLLPDSGENDAVLGRMDFVSPGYLEALGIRLLAGRRFTEADNQLDGERVAIINDFTARRFYPAGDAVGQPIVVQGQTWRIIGVVDDVVDRRLDAPFRAFAYVPSAFNLGTVSVALRTSVDPGRLVASVRAATADVDPGVAVARPRTLDRAMAESMLERRVVVALFLTFAVAGLLLAAIGLYGVMAYAVATRRREFGVRLAVGATPGRLLRQVMHSGLRVAGVGLLIGLGVALVAGRLLASQLYGVTATDPVVMGQTVAIVIAVAALASLLPAWRASRLSLIAALAEE